MGVEEIRLDISVDGEFDADTEAALQRVTERYCVVFQTLVSPPVVEPNWEFQ